MSRYLFLSLCVFFSAAQAAETDAWGRAAIALNAAANAVTVSVRAGNPLLAARNLVITPHVSADSPATYNPDSLDILLENLRAALASAYGITARGRQRHGALVDVLLEAEPQVRLFVIGKRGEHADVAAGHLGSNLERVVRAVHRPVLVASRGFRPVQCFAIAFDGSPTTRRCVEMVCASPLLKGLDAHLLMAGNDDATHRDAANWARAQLAAAGFAPALAIEPGRAAEVIARHVAAEHIDLLVMGAYGHSRIRTMIVGSTTTELLRTCTIPILLLR